jgi:putative transposase
MGRGWFDQRNGSFGSTPVVAPRPRSGRSNRRPECGRFQRRLRAETELHERLRSLAAERRRFGYQRLFVLLRREGEPSGKNRIYRLYREEGLTVRKRRPRRRAIGHTAADPGRGQGQRPLVARLRARPVRRRASVPDPQRGRRRHPRVALAAIPDTSISGRAVGRAN